MTQTGASNVSKFVYRRPRHSLLATLPVAIAWILIGSSTTRADDPDNCLLCHQYRGLGRIEEDSDRVHLYFVDPDYGPHAKGPHARLACTDCHQQVEVGVIPHGPVTPVNCTQTCHLSNPNGLERIFSHDNIPPMLNDSAHSVETLNKIEFSNGPLLNEGQSTCLYCHDEPIFRDAGNVIPQLSDLGVQSFDRCEVCHSNTVPVDINYYVKHVASRLQPARSTLGTAQVCSVCHSDPKVNEQFEMNESIASFVRSFHGKAALLGDTETADCLSCHVMKGENAHLMLGSTNPLSSVHPSHVANSCRSVNCHPGADMQLAQTAVHLDIPTAEGTLEYGLAAMFILITVLTFGPSALLVILDIFQIIIGRHDHHATARPSRLLAKIHQHPQGDRKLVRFSVRQRIEHWVLAVSFTLLVITGFPLKFAEDGWASVVVSIFGGPAATRFVHHWAGVALVLGFAVHIVNMLLVFRRNWRDTYRRDRTQGKWTAAWNAWNALPMWITVDDVKKTFQLIGYLLFLRKERPTFGRFSPTEKFEYLGVFWGTVLLGITGAILWGMHLSSHFLTGRAFNLATIAHTYEAFLAVIHVGILHIYNVIFAPKVFPLSPATITGQTPDEKLVEEHGDLIDDVARELNISDGPA